MREIIITETKRHCHCNDCGEHRLCFTNGPKWLCSVCLRVLIFRGTGVMVGKLMGD